MTQFENERNESKAADFEIKDGELIRYRGNAAHVIIPEGVEDISMHAIDTAFTSEDTRIVSLFIPKSVKRISRLAFVCCKNLESVILEGGGIHIASDAFLECVHLKKVYAPSLASWCQNVFHNEAANPLFYGAELVIGGQTVRELNVPSGIEIGHYQFTGCTSITDVTIPASAKRIGIGAFQNCCNIKHMSVPESVLTWMALTSGLTADPDSFNIMDYYEEDYDDVSLFGMSYELSRFGEDSAADACADPSA